MDRHPRNRSARRVVRLLVCALAAYVMTGAPPRSHAGEPTPAASGDTPRTAPTPATVRYGQWVIQRGSPARVRRADGAWRVVGDHIRVTLRREGALEVLDRVALSGRVRIMGPHDLYVTGEQAEITPRSATLRCVRPTLIREDAQVRAQTALIDLTHATLALRHVGHVKKTTASAAR